jgi:hypothetical protein
MGTRNRRKHPSITIHISRAQNSIWFRESPGHKQIADLCGGGRNTHDVIL